MGGHLVLVVQNAQMHEQIIQTLAGEGVCALCFLSVEEAVLYLRDRNNPASVAVFNVAMRRASDWSAVAGLATDRPGLRLLYVAHERKASGAELPGGLRVQVLEKPLNHPDSVQSIRKSLKHAASSEVAIESGTSQGGVSPYSEEFLRRVGMADVPVLLSGETGVGKEVMARRLRSYSSRADKPFLKINCAALPPELAESELFGSAKGAFTGAVNDRQGRFETADGGTLLLDEIGDMDLRLQTKLLQVLQDGEIQPLGSNRILKVNVRVLAATHRDLTRAIEEGTFREDLYYRLNVIRILIPPLRERKTEILPLARELLLRHLPRGAKAPGIDDDLQHFLIEYSWPGNVRELENVMRRYLVYQNAGLLIQELKEASRTGAGALRSAGLARVGPSPGGSASEDSAVSVAGASNPEKPESLDRLAEASRSAEIELLLEALETNRWNRRQAAASLQIEYKAFLYKLQKYGIAEGKGKRREVNV